MIISRYIAKRLIAIYIATLLILLIVGITSDIVKNIDKFINCIAKGNIVTALNYYMFKSVFMVYFLAATSYSIGASLCFCSFWKTNEIVSILTAGMSNLRLLRSTLLTGLVSGLCLFALDELCFPYLLPKMWQLENEMKTKEVTFNITSVDSTGSRMDASKYDRVNGLLENITVIFLNENLEKWKKITAKNGRWDDKLSSWMLYNGTIEEYEKGLIKVIKTGDKIIIATNPISSEGFILGEKLFKSDTFYRSNLGVFFGLSLKETRKLSRIYPDANLYKVMIAMKLSNIIIPIALCLPCILIIFKNHVKSYPLAVSIALMMNLLFFSIHLMLINLGRDGIVDPYMSTFITSFICIILCAIYSKLK
ncbi:MAG: LptF/LptG family permease [Planctomycetes bacterium]|nr:LptF/LptG family permease [Planctomycetota bacterium]